MLNIKITLAEKDDATDLLINTQHFNLHFEYSDKEEAALGALKFLHDMGIIKELTEEAETDSTEEEAPAADIPAPTAPTSLEGYITLDEVCVMTKLKPNSVYSFISDSIFPPADKKFQRRNYWLRETIEKYLKDKKAKIDSLEQSRRHSKKEKTPDVLENFDAPEPDDELLDFEEQLDLEDIIKSVAG